MPKPDTVYQFSDYRTCLAAQASSGLSSRKVTLPTLAKRLGYHSPRTFAMVLKGQRLPSADMINRCAKAFSWTKDETVYFTQLVRLERSRLKGHDVAPLKEQLERLSPQLQGETKLSEKRFGLLSEWYHLPIRQMVGTPSFREDSLWIRQRLRNKVSCAEVDAALEALLEQGFLRRHPQTKKLELIEVPLATSNDIPSQAIRAHHRQMLKRAEESLEEQPVHRREITSVTFRFSAARMREAQKVIREFKDSFHKMFEAKGAEAVMQLNIQFFEHTETALYPQEAQMKQLLAAILLIGLFGCSPNPKGGDSVGNGGDLSRSLVLDAKQLLIARIKAHDKERLRPGLRHLYPEAIDFIASQKVTLLWEAETLDYEIVEQLPMSAGAAVTSFFPQSAVFLSRPVIQSFTVLETGWLLAHEITHHFPNDLRTRRHQLADEVAHTLFPEVKKQAHAGELPSYEGLLCESKGPWQIRVYFLEDGIVELEVARAGTDIPTTVNIRTTPWQPFPRRTSWAAHRFTWAFTADLGGRELTLEISHAGGTLDEGSQLLGNFVRGKIGTTTGLPTFLRNFLFSEPTSTPLVCHYRRQLQH